MTCIFGNSRTSFSGYHVYHDFHGYHDYRGYCGYQYGHHGYRGYRGYPGTPGCYGNLPLLVSRLALHRVTNWLDTLLSIMPKNPDLA